MVNDMYTLEEIAALRQKCASLKLEGAEKLDKYKNAELQKICNGIGPEAFPYGVRSITTSLHPTLEPVAVIHDVEFEESDGLKSTFTAINDRYYTNGIAAAKAEYGWYNPVRYVVIAQALRHARLCQLGGWCGYRELHERNRSNGS